MNKPCISVVIPLYNKGNEVARSINTVCKQTLADFEVIVVNDGSTDSGREIVRAFNDTRIHLIDQANSGVSEARNRGIAEARADLVAFLDADDEWRPDFLETVLRLSERFPECGVFATSYIYRYNDGNKRSAIIRGVDHTFVEGVIRDYFNIAAQSDPPLCSSAVAVRKAAITAIGGFPKDIDSGEDLLTWARLAVRFDIAYCRTPLAIFWAPLRFADRTPRLPRTPDLVATGLARLLIEASPEQMAGLRQYLAMWHRMRASVFLKFNMTADTRNEIKASAEYSGMTTRLLILRLLCCFPGKLPASIQQTMYRLLQRIRSTKGSYPPA